MTYREKMVILDLIVSVVIVVGLAFILVRAVLS